MGHKAIYCEMPTFIWGTQMLSARMLRLDWILISTYAIECHQHCKYNLYCLQIKPPPKSSEDTDDSQIF